MTARWTQCGGHRTVSLAEQKHRALDTPALQVAMRRLAKD